MLNSEFTGIKPKFDKWIVKLMNGDAHLSFSSFRNFMTAPRVFFKNKMFKEQTKAMLEGVQFHMCCLEPELYDDTYVVVDDSEVIEKIGGSKPRATKAYRDWKSEMIFDIESKGKILMDASNDALFRSMRDYLRLNSMSSAFLNKCNNPESKHEFEFAGFKWTSKIDEMCYDYTLDLKKMANVEDRKIIWNIKDALLDYQGALYSIPAQTPKHVILAIDVEHNINVVEISEERIEFCLNRLKYFVEKFKECVETDSWHEGKNFFNTHSLVMNS